MTSMISSSSAWWSPSAGVRPVAMKQSMNSVRIAGAV